MKVCIDCKIEQNDFYFYRRNEFVARLNRCDTCRLAWQKQYNLTHRQSVEYKNYHKNYQRDRRVKFKELNGKAYETLYQKNRKNTDINFKLAAMLRSRLYCARKKQSKVGSAVSDLGCTLDVLKEHLEKQFQVGMSWDNYGRAGWHIDHIKPLASFDLTNRIQFLQAAHYTNLQPLWAHDNLSKKDNLHYKINQTL